MIHVLWSENISCHIDKKCHSSQQFLASKCEWGLPKLRSNRCYPRPHKWFSEPKGLHLPIHRMLNSLTWYLIFDVQTAFVTNLYIVGLPLLPPSSSLRTNWGAASQAAALFLPQIKLNSQLSRCEYILVDTFFLKKWYRTDIQQECHERGRDWKDVATNQGMLRISGCSQKL